MTKIYFETGETREVNRTFDVVMEGFRAYNFNVIKGADGKRIALFKTFVNDRQAVLVEN